MHEYVIQAIRNIRIEFFNVEDPIRGNQGKVIGVKLFKDLRPEFGIVQDIRGAKVFPAEDKEQDIAKTEKIEGKRPLREIKIIVEVDPAETAILVVDKDMITPDITMLESMGMEQRDPAHGLKKIHKHVFQVVLEILLMCRPQILQVFIHPLSLDNIKDTDKIAGFVQGGIPLHEERVSLDQLDNLGLLFRTPVTGHLQFADSQRIGLMKGQFGYFMFT